MQADDLTIDLDNLEPETLLQHWRWLLGPRQLPIMVTTLGDVFVQNLDTQQISYLNTASADLIPVANSVDELSEKLADDTFVTDYFAPELVALLQQNYGELPPQKLFGLEIPDELGGEYELEDIHLVDIQQHFDSWGKIHKESK